MDFVGMKGHGFVGQLVKARMVKSFYHDHDTDDIIEELYEDSKLGFIIDLHAYIDDYYLIRFFDGSCAWCWKAELLSRKNLEISLDKYR